ncbi:MAG: hypothetical protein WAU00_01170 [Caldilinea sp.]|uniref:hypothetical protein n=1 Tax=Caldilinea sp. TaxID=2293560 RepID=UPI002C7F7E79|nr:hypothetical protein [Anaerolineales bacterium]HQY92453.1 hypothetical protein [Caldilinea sp.]
MAAEPTGISPTQLFSTRILIGLLQIANPNDPEREMLHKRLKPRLLRQYTPTWQFTQPAPVKSHKKVLFLLPWQKILICERMKASRHL